MSEKVERKCECVSSDFGSFIRKLIAEDNMEACFNAFDKNCDDHLDIKEFETLCKALFRNEKGEIYELNKEWKEDMFNTFDHNGDGLIDRREFVFCWNYWIKTIVRPVCALVVIDVQNDFISGSLDMKNCPAQQNGEDVIKPINHVLDSHQFEVVIYSYDWHPSDHVSFFDNLHMRKLHSTSPIKSEEAKVFDTVFFDGEPPMVQKLWPRHCVQNSWGSELHKDLKVVNNALKIYKGTNPEVDSYSVFWDNMRLTDTRLDSQLKLKNITDVFVCGLAYDFCVGCTALDALQSGYRTILLNDCCRGVDHLTIEEKKSGFIKNFGIIVESSAIKNLMSGNDRRPELGYKLALELKKSRI